MFGSSMSRWPHAVNGVFSVLFAWNSCLDSSVR